MKSNLLVGPSNIIRQWLIHFSIVWLIVNILTFCNYFLSLTRIQGDIWHYIVAHNFNYRDIGFLLVITLLTELNYGFFFEKNRLEIFITGSCLVGLTVSVYLLLLSPMPGSVSARFIMLLRGPMIFLILYPLMYGLVRDFLNARIRRAETEARHFETELNSLKAQVNPHFFFNTFNYLYGTALLEKAEKTADGIEMMSSMMRYTLTGMQNTFVPLEDELKFLETYIILQRLRIPVTDKTQLLFEISDESQSLLIAPLLLIPFVENAFKYGLSLEQPCRINMKVFVRDRLLQFTSENSIISSESVTNGTNNGISLTRRRLELLYPGRYHLTCGPMGDVYKVNLTINL